MGLNVGEIFVSLGFKSDTYKVKDFIKSIKEMPLSVASAITALAGLDLGIVHMIGHTLDVANGLSIFSAETGLNTQQLQRWQNVAKGVGLSADTATTSIMGIADAVTQITKFGAAGPAIAFGRLGISDYGTANAFKLLDELRQKYKALKTPAQKQEFESLLGGIGVSPAMAAGFALPDKQFEGLYNTGPTMSKSDLQNMAKLQQALTKFNDEVAGVFAQALSAAIPYIGDLAESLKMITPYLARMFKGAGEDVRTVNKIEKMGGFGTFFKGLMNEYSPFATAASGDAPTMDETIRNMLDSRGKAGKNVDDVIHEVLKTGVRTTPMADGPVTNNMSVTQHIHGVTDGADADHVGARHLKAELGRTAKALVQEQ